MIYLASPYSHPDPTVRHQRFRAVCRAAAELVRAGHAVFAPIVHSHPLVEFGLPTDWSFWQRHDEQHLERCDEVVVLMLDGWRESVGVAAEVGRAQSLGKPVWYIWPSFRATSHTFAHVAQRSEGAATHDERRTNATAGYVCDDVANPEIRVGTSGGLGVGAGISPRLFCA